MISARGSTRLYSNKILVMIDGRSLYTPLFSGVLWDSVDVPLEDVERIEVVLGPGAVMWGPNAGQRRDQHHNQEHDCHQRWGSFA